MKRWLLIVAIAYFHALAWAAAGVNGCQGTIGATTGWALSGGSLVSCTIGAAGCVSNACGQPTTPGLACPAGAIYAYNSRSFSDLPGNKSTCQNAYTLGATATLSDWNNGKTNIIFVAGGGGVQIAPHDLVTPITNGSVFTGPMFQMALDGYNVFDLYHGEVPAAYLNAQANPGDTSIVCHRINPGYFWPTATPYQVCVDSTCGTSTSQSLSGNNETINLSAPWGATSAAGEPCYLADTGNHGNWDPNILHDVTCHSAWLAHYHVGNSMDIRVFAASNGAYETLREAMIGSAALDTSTCDQTDTNFRITAVVPLSLPANQSPISQLAAICSTLTCSPAGGDGTEPAYAGGHAGPSGGALSNWGSFTQATTGALNSSAGAWVSSIGTACGAQDGLIPVSPTNGYLYTQTLSPQALAPSSTIPSQWTPVNPLPRVTGVVGDVDGDVTAIIQQCFFQQMGAAQVTLTGTSGTHFLDMTLGTNPCASSGNHWCIASQAIKTVFQDLGIIDGTYGTTVTITLAGLPDGRFGVAYPTTTVTMTGGTGPYTWVAYGLPTGLTINSSTGVISGTPISSTVADVAITVQDSSSPIPNLAINNYQLNVGPALPSAISRSPAL